MLAFFAFAIFVSASLLFAIQPMVGKMVLPTLGGSPSVWNTCMVFFQSVLLLGYFYAFAIRKLSVKAQIIIHLTIMAFASLLLPISMTVVLPDSIPQDAGVHLSLWLSGHLAIMAGGPFFVLSSTAPLLQSWFSRTDHTSARDPYFLYVASNAGSMLGLLAYPILIEPMIGVSRQGVWWSVGYAVLGGVMLIASASCWRRLQTAPAEAVQSEVQQQATKAASCESVRWCPAPSFCTRCYESRCMVSSPVVGASLL